MSNLDSTRLQVLWNRLLAIVEEQAQALIRAAFSPIVRECGDISAGIFDLQGRMLAQAVTGTPGHINTMAEAVKYLRARFPLQEMKPGDIYVTNDPWIASGHLNDFLLLMPAFHDGRVVGFTACTSHLVDLGGLGMGPEGSDIFDEGLLVPPCKLADGGEINALLLEIVKANSREPIANEGDLYALMACCDVGAKRLADMMVEFGLETLDPLAGHIIEISRRGTLAALADLPRGSYRNELLVDGYESEIALCAELAVEKDGITLDFSGTSGCSRKGINVPLNYATAYSVFALRCLIGPEIPNNAGSLAPFKVTAPKDCILNAQAPAPVAMRHTLGQLMPDLVYGCLHQILPERRRTGPQWRHRRQAFQGRALGHRFPERGLGQSGGDHGIGCTRPGDQARAAPRQRGRRTLSRRPGPAHRTALRRWPAISGFPIGRTGEIPRARPKGRSCGGSGANQNRRRPGSAGQRRNPCRTRADPDFRNTRRRRFRRPKDPAP